MRHVAVVLIFVVSVIVSTGAVRADVLRVAYWDSALSRKGPGILMRDLMRGADEQAMRASLLLAQVDPDILVIKGIDFDAENAAVLALGPYLSEHGLRFPYAFSSISNGGLPSGFDLNSDGFFGGPDDAIGWGQFIGQDGIAVFSKYPILTEGFRNFGAQVWADFAWSKLPKLEDGSNFFSDQIRASLPLTSGVHWELPIQVNKGLVVHLIIVDATPPVFDGKEDANGLRNRDEIRLLENYISGEALGDSTGQTSALAFAPFIIAGTFNADPNGGDADGRVVASLLDHPKIVDPRPIMSGQGVDRTWTALWDKKDRPRGLRVDYVLPSAEFLVTDAGLVGVENHQDLAKSASHHRLVWVDIRLSEKASVNAKGALDANKEH